MSRSPGLPAVAAYRLPAPVRLEIFGEDRLRFLQTQTSNDLRGTSAGRWVRTVLCLPIARIIDVFHVFERDEALEVLSDSGRARELGAYLEDRIFFGDRLEIVDKSRDTAQWELCGPGAAEWLRERGCEAPPPGAQRANEVEGIALRVLAGTGPGGAGFRLTVPADQSSRLKEALATAGAELLSGENWNALRVEAGLPAFGGELTEEYNPLEVGLERAVSIEKGCYTGQEVLARQINFDKISRRLMGLRAEQACLPGQTLQSEAGKPVGRVTSAAHSPRFGHIALAVLKRSFCEPGQVLQLCAGEHTRPVTVSVLPFTRG